MYARDQPPHFTLAWFRSPCCLLLFAPQVGSQPDMAKEEDVVKKIELKVSVNCCDGCRKKIMKALSIKGVLKTDIHPTLPKVTVLGNVEPQTLIKKLAKCGKTAALWPADPKKHDKEEQKSEGSMEKEVMDASAKGGNNNAKGTGDGAKKCRSGQTAERNPESDDKNKTKPGDNLRREDDDKGEGKAQKEVEIGGTEVVKNVKPSCTTGTLPTTVTALPLVNYLADPGTAQDSGSHAAGRVFYPVESYPAPLRYCTANACAAPLPPPCCIQDYYYTSPPVNHHQSTPPSQPSLPSQFGDYFNDENTIGCNVM